MPDAKLTVAAFTAGRHVPSARFRVRQLIAPLAARGIGLTESYPASGGYPPARRWLRPLWAAASLGERLWPVISSHRADLVLLQREMLSTRATLERFTGRPRVLDVDDAVHLYRDGRAMRTLAGLCDAVICGNAWLAEVYAGYGARVEVVPTAVDAAAIPATPYGRGRRRIGWIGTQGNLAYLAPWADALSAVLAAHSDVELVICSDGAPQLSRLGPPGRVVHLPWHPSIEAGFLSSLWVGLMPLPDTPWARGKCAFKMLQYMAAARPVVVSPVGMNAELLAEGEVGLGAASPGDVRAGLLELLAHPELAAQMGRAGRRLVEARYDVIPIATRLAGIFRGLAGKH